MADIWSVDVLHCTGGASSNYYSGMNDLDLNDPDKSLTLAMFAIGKYRKELEASGKEHEFISEVLQDLRTLKENLN